MHTGLQQYALENRVVMSRILPEIFRDFHVQRLAGYFQAYRDTLMRLAPPGAGYGRASSTPPGATGRECGRPGNKAGARPFFSWLAIRCMAEP